MQTINKGSKRVSKDTFRRLLNELQMKCIVREVLVSSKESLYEVDTDKGTLKVQYKSNGWLTIT